MFINCEAQVLELCFHEIYWPLILKFSCFVLFLLDLGLNSKISVLRVFKDILFALSHVLRTFKLWLMFIFFKKLSTRSKLASSAKWCTLLNFMTLMYIRKSSGPRTDPKLYQSIVRFLTTHCYMLFSIS